ncbi:zinc-binding dehydrogenase, partial [Salmonella enterica subsp. enterica serovar Anatum]|nr:zinc-binding dehydrogenase [Salmonella enterica subsp. enterica serovar Anatum]
RLELARKMGVTRAVNVAKESLNDVIAELGMTEGFDVGLEMSGVTQTWDEYTDKTAEVLAPLGVNVTGIHRVADPLAAIEKAE